MSKLVWDKTGEKYYETGVSNGVLYPQSSNGTYPKGVAWDGLTAFTESPSGAEATPLYADNKKYLNLISAEDYGVTIEAYQSPEEFDECDGSKEVAPGVYAGQQNRKVFGFVCKTLIGNDTDGTEYGYKLHLVYNALATPSEKAHSTTNESPEAMTLSWTLSTTPVEVPGVKATACLTIDSTKTEAGKLAALEAILFGGDEIEARLPLPAEIITLMADAQG
jgi:hypothetical protein